LASYRYFTGIYVSRLWPVFNSNGRLAKTPIHFCRVPDVIKKLFVLATLLAPCVSYGASPSADLSVQIVSSTPPVPAVAQAAGFTTLALNSDFSQPLYAIQSNWLDCFPNGNKSLPWHEADIFNKGNAPPCNVPQVQDPVTGDTVIDMYFDPSWGDTCKGCIQNQLQLVTKTRDGTVPVSYPTGYYEIEMRANWGGTYSSGCSTVGAGAYNAMWFGIDGGFEWDNVEANGCPNGGAGSSANWHNWGVAGDPAGNLYADGSVDITQYHKYGMLISSTGGSSVKVASYLDDQLRGSYTLTIPYQMNASQQNARYDLVMAVGNFGSGVLISKTLHQYVRHMRIWSCPSWQSTNCATAP
jgi:hypothetical protein